MKRHIFMFMPRFAPLVEAGLKLQTIRALRKIPVNVGDIVDLRQWTGKPYRSKQRNLRESICTDVQGIIITESFIKIGAFVSVSHMGALETLNAFAVADGFVDWNEMREWFRVPRGLPFEGFVTFWEPLSKSKEAP